MLITGRLSVVSALLWFFITPGPVAIFMIVVASAINGLMLPGLEISSQNSFLNASPEKNRSMFIATYFCFTSLVGVGLANTLGGWLLDNVFAVAEGAGLSMFGIEFNRYNFLFILSFVLRVTAVFVLLPRMVYETSAKPARETVRTIMHILGLKKRLR